MQRSKNSRRAGRQTEYTNYADMIGKVYVEDLEEMQNESLMAIQTQQRLESKREMMNMKNIITPQMKQREDKVKEKLEALSKLFAEDELNEQVENIQKTWKSQKERKSFGIRNMKGMFQSSQP